MNTFGALFKFTTFGESHGPGLGVIVDGCPAGLELDIGAITHELERRRPGQSKFVTPRKEKDEFEILSGIFEGKTTGAPIAALIRNKDVKSKDYSAIKDLFRPGHADFTYHVKYGHRDYRGGGRSSARETAARVIAGTIAKLIIPEVEIRGGLVQLGPVKVKNYVWDSVESNPFRSVDPEAVAEMEAELEKARKAHDSLGGIVEVQALNVPVGLGEPIYKKLDAEIASAMMSIPAVKGVEIGRGFELGSMSGSVANDEMSEEGFLSNNHGGILGGISSGAPIVIRLALKPTSSIAREQKTIDTNFKEQTISTKGRHDPCVALRAAPIAEAMLAAVLADFYLMQKASKGIAGQEKTELSYGLKD